MTLPGEETMKGGIMGDDCFRCMAGLDGGAPVCGIWESNCAGIESMGDLSGVWVECEERFKIPTGASQ